jgi:predicted CoA-substrate-specific enzyme activase
MITAGIDAGSRAVKVVLLEAEQLRMIDSATGDQGVEQDAIARRLFGRLLERNGLGREGIGRIVATGYARNGVSLADTTITEITCHARGVHHEIQEARTVIEIGGQDSKVLRLYDDGSVRDFAMNDRCAAGTGRFLEMVAARLEVGLEELTDLAGRSRKPASISSMCVVFAETEIIGLLAGGTPPEDIVAGVQNAIASRITGLAGRHLTEPVVFTGGVALIPGMAAALESVLERPVAIAPHPQITGALGAALLAASELHE